MRVTLIVLVLGATGCDRACARNTASTDAAAPATTPLTAASIAPPPRASAALPAADASATISAAAWTRYWAAMKRGRTATVEKRYSDATHAFTEALAEVARDARAMSERGYAKYLAGDDGGAHADLQAAVDTVPASDKKLSAQIYFNEGLVADRAGLTDAAGSYYRQSYELNPTAAAKSKMSPCPVLVDPFATDLFADRKAAIADIARKPDFKSWDDSYPLDGNPVAANEDEIDGAYAIVPVGSGVAVVSTDQDVTRGPKGASGNVEVQKQGSEWVVTVQANVAGESFCEPDGPCQVSAYAEGGSRDIYYVDATTGAGLWHVSFDHAFVDQIRLHVEGGELHVTGAGCGIVKPR